MERKIKLGFVGTHVRMDLIRSVVPNAFPELQLKIYENERYDYCYIQSVLKELNDR